MAKCNAFDSENYVNSNRSIGHSEEPQSVSFEMQLGSWPLPSGRICVVDFNPLGTDTKRGYSPDRIKAHFIEGTSPRDLVYYFQAICPEIVKALIESASEFSEEEPV